MKRQRPSGMGGRGGGDGAGDGAGGMVRGKQGPPDRHGQWTRRALGLYFAASISCFILMFLYHQQRQ